MTITTEITWHDAKQIPDTHWNKNDALSIMYLCIGDGLDAHGNQIIGYSYYSYDNKQWADVQINGNYYKVLFWADNFSMSNCLRR